MQIGNSWFEDYKTKLQFQKDLSETKQYVSVWFTIQS